MPLLAVPVLRCALLFGSLVEAVPVGVPTLLLLALLLLLLLLRFSSVMVLETPPDVLELVPESEIELAPPCPLPEPFTEEPLTFPTLMVIGTMGCCPAAGCSPGVTAPALECEQSSEGMLAVGGASTR